MNITDLDFGGLKLISLEKFTDERGDFLKTFNRSWFDNFELDFKIEEEFFSTSKKNVIRGMHFQKPPFDHHKLVRCLSGEVLDVVVDLRKSSQNFKKCKSIILSDKRNEMLFIPRGFAHGFLAIEDNSIMQYLVSAVHSKDHDCGILYDSIGFDWKVDGPIVSTRDQGFASLDAYVGEFE